MLIRLILRKKKKKLFDGWNDQIYILSARIIKIHDDLTIEYSERSHFDQFL